MSAEDGLLAGADFGTSVDHEPHTKVSRIGHCFAAIRVDAFRPLEDFKRDMDTLIRELKDAPKAAGQERIYIPGEKEFEKAELNAREGVPLLAEVVKGLVEAGNQAGVPFDLSPIKETAQ